MLHGPAHSIEECMVLMEYTKKMGANSLTSKPVKVSDRREARLWSLSQVPKRRIT